MSEGFACTWRKRRACTRCRKIKVRCEYDSPDTVRCTRCVRAGVHCQVPDFGGSKASSRQTNGHRRPSQLAEEVSSPIVTSLPKISDLVIPTSPPKSLLGVSPPNSGEEDRASRIARLQKVRDDVERELRTLQSAEGDKNKINCVDGAINQGLLTEQEARNLYAMFSTHAANTLMFGPEILVDFNDMKRFQPVLSLAIITASACCTRGSSVDQLIQYLDRVICDLLFTMQAPSCEIVRALIVMCVYIHPNPGSKAPMYVLLALSLCAALDPGSSKDIEVLLDVNRHSAERDIARGKMDTYIDLYLCLMPLALGAQRLQLLRMLPMCYKYCDVLVQMGSQRDLITAHTLNLMFAGTECLETMAILGDSPGMMVSAVKSSLDHHHSRLADLAKQVTLVRSMAEGHVDARIKARVYAFTACYRVIVINLYEISLGFLAKKPRATLESKDELMFLQEIIDQLVTVCVDDIVDQVEIASAHGLLSKYLYFRPLHDCASLMRIYYFMRALHGSKCPKREQKIEFLKGTINDGLGKIKSLFPRWMNTYTGSHMVQVTTKVEKWWQDHCELIPTTAQEWECYVARTPIQLLRHVISDGDKQMKPGYVGLMDQDQYFDQSFVVQIGHLLNFPEDSSSK
uniref:ARAD1D01694p n=1 Tax=Blastobotrys adeninivorans TaxID=409370 RepID=A0A060T7A2_BLAAD